MNDSIASRFSAGTFVRLASAAAPLALVLAACSSAATGDAETELTAQESAELGAGTTLWPAAQKRNLTYCIDRERLSTHAYVRLVVALNRARAAWAKEVDISFPYLPAEDGDCPTSTKVLFRVGVGPHGFADGREDPEIETFDPKTPASSRWLRVQASSLADESADIDRLMLHALGHVLGFTHETDAVCNPSFVGRRMGPFDNASIMVSGDCPFASTSLSATDIRHAQLLYGGNTACPAESDGLCETFGATCIGTRSSAGVRVDACKWSATAQAECEQANGTWTTASDAAAMGFPTLVSTGAACVRLGSDLHCPIAERDLCERHGAQCEHTVSTTGTVRNLCRWPNVTSETACHTLATGIWTPSGSSFTNAFPRSVPREPGACITQVNNLKCTTAERQLCETHGGLCEVASENGVRKNLCRWANVTTEAACRATTDGRWILPAAAWDDAVRAGRDGACVASFAELKNAPDRTPRIWERGCAGKIAPADMRLFFFDRANPNVPCEDHTRGITTAWKVTDAIRGYSRGLCIATWTGTGPMVAADRDLLEHWAVRIDNSGIGAFCATTTPTCTLATCPKIAAAIDHNGNPGKANEIGSGCPKCGMFEDKTLFVVRDPVRANEEQIVVPFQATPTAVVVIPANGQQIVEVPLTPAQYTAMGSPKDGAQAFVMTREELEPYSIAHGFPPPAP